VETKIFSFFLDSNEKLLNTNFVRFSRFTTVVLGTFSFELWLANYFEISKTPIKASYFFVFWAEYGPTSYLAHVTKCTRF